MLFSKRKVSPDRSNPAVASDAVVAMEPPLRDVAEAQPPRARAAEPLPVAPQIHSAPTTPLEEAGATLTIDCSAIGLTTCVLNPDGSAPICIR